MNVQPRFKRAKQPKAKGRARPDEPLGECEVCRILVPADPVHRGSRPHQATERHHVLRRSQGGSDDRSNTLEACQFGHAWIHSHPAESYRLGLLERSGGVPEGTDQ